MSETMNFELYTTHSNVTFVNFNVLVFPGWLWMLPFIITQVNINTIKGKVNILGCKVYPGWDSIHNLTILKLNFTFYFRKLRNVLLDWAFPMTEFILNNKNILLFDTRITFCSIRWSLRKCLLFLLQEPILDIRNDLLFCVFQTFHNFLSPYSIHPRYQIAWSSIQLYLSISWRYPSLLW